MAEVLCNFTLWWKGPTWLGRPPDEWPSRKDLIRCKPLPELRQTIMTITTSADDLLERFSNYYRALRVLSWVKRFVYNCKKDKADRRTGTRLRLEELESTERMLITQLQQQHFSAEIKALEKSQSLPTASSILDRRPFLDRHQLLRVGGRLQRKGLELTISHPLIYTERLVFPS